MAVADANAKPDHIESRKKILVVSNRWSSLWYLMRALPSLTLNAAEKMINHKLYISSFETLNFSEEVKDHEEKWTK